ncbi:MAG: long-chain fatty acid--CoA ligase [Salinimicrobium sediminis]|uniref:Long-chain acyl-CoA synthetase n=1 Tax=Salinimicrobium sediminis TaxID=1343891 RepID=A0A285X806_9FLAO|nr:long-chain fatty acid--CoA ligase [Salinimicrobium sediminis]MDX1602393.1 long-chain fatty acid--CoA ligase [Salinimicrobium sediminis]SOC81428.1 long-chain acyl-CoA synthetase [Salinimicrobium sediminis]
MIEIKRLFDFPYFQLENAPQEKSLVTKYNGKWEALSSQQYIDQANAVSRGLLRLGIQPNDKIAVISTSNRTEWNVLDIGILQLGAQNVPIYPTVSEEDYEYVINHSESIYCFVSDKEILDKLTKVRGNTQLKGIYTFDEIPGAENWKEIHKMGEDKSNQEEVEARKKAVKEDDLATLIYTSGTTGRPKGVMLSHKNIVSDVLLSSDRVPFEFGTYTALSFLPVCHIFERMILYLYQYYSVSIHFAESIDKISDNLKEVKPHVISAVPRLLEKVYDKIIAKGSTVGGIKQKLFFWSVELGLEYEPYGKNGWWYETKLSIARKLVFSKWKEGLGGRIELIVSGSAALQPRLARVFAAAGIPVMEGYGLTETSPVIAVNDQRNGGFKIGTVGRVLKDVEVKIAEDGEILCKGPNVMQGYYKEPEKTKEAINEDGYFHTGDIGELDSDGFLKITDRKKEMFKTSGGKYVAPQLIENQMKQSRFIAEMMVVGEGEKMPAALIQPDFEFVREWAKRKHVELGPTNEDLINNDRVRARIQEEVDFYNQKFGSWEKIKKFELTPDVWSIEGEHLTPTMKLKRRNIIKLYQKLYDGIYER